MAVVRSKRHTHTRFYPTSSGYSVNAESGAFLRNEMQFEHAELFSCCAKEDCRKACILDESMAHVSRTCMCDTSCSGFQNTFCPVS